MLGGDHSRLPLPPFAQVAANQRGIALVHELIGEYGLGVVQAYMRHICANAEHAVREMLREFSLSRGLPEVGTVAAEDHLDDGSRIALSVTIDRRDGSAVFDFEGTGPEIHGNLNAPPAVTYSAIIFSLRCLVRQDIPLNQGCLAPVSIKIPDGSLLRPSATAAVVGGNVLTSQRVTDVVLRAFEACAASQGVRALMAAAAAAHASLLGPRFVPRRCSCVMLQPVLTACVWQVISRNKYASR